jgi:hypothetical protein
MLETPERIADDVRWLDTDLETLADTLDAFATSVVQEAALAREPALVSRRRKFASLHSWAERAERLAGPLELPA